MLRIYSTAESINCICKRYGFGVKRGGPPGVFFDVQQAVISANTGGTDDFTKLGFGTPKAVLNSLQFTDTSGTITADGIGNVGFGDGTNNVCGFWSSEDGVVTMNTQRISDRLVSVQTFIPSSNVTQGRAQISNITDGCRYTWIGSAYPTDLVANNLMFGGPACEGAVGISEGSLSNNATDAITVGFQPDFIFLLSGQAGASSLAQVDGSVTFGFCDASLNQGCLWYFDRDGIATSLVETEISNTRIAKTFNPADGDTKTLEVISIESDGFTVRATTDGASYGGARSWLALKLENSSGAKVGTLDLPTATGSHSITSVGFKPRLVVQLSSLLTAYDSKVSQNALFGLSMIKNDIQVSGGTATEDGVGTAAARSGMDNKAIYFPDPAGATEWEGDFEQFTGNGYDIDYTKVPGGSAVKGLYAAFK